MKRGWWMWVVGLWCLCSLAWAVPTLDAVQAELRQGHYDRAESMMREVVEAHPRSARAHYVYAEVLARNHHYDTAREQARLAREADPKIGFTDTRKFQDFENRLAQAAAGNPGRAASAGEAGGLALDRPHDGAGSTAGANTGSAAGTPDRANSPRTVPPPPHSASASGFKVPGWLWGLIGAALALGLWRMLSARRASPAMAYGPNGPAYGMNGSGGNPVSPYGGYGSGPQAGPGRGMLGAGLAAAGGFAAGMLAEKMLEGSGGREPPRASHDDGLIPGAFDTPAAPPSLDDRPIDFGIGDGWGGDGDGGSGGSDDWT